MGIPCIDPSPDSTCGKCMGHKMSSYVVAYSQIILWILNIIGIVFTPSSANNIVNELTKAEMAVLVITILICTIFSILLLIGLHKERRIYIKIYMIFCAVFTVVLMFWFVVNIFTQPARIGFKGFISEAITIFIYVIFFAVIRSYYLVTYS